MASNIQKREGASPPSARTIDPLMSLREEMDRLFDTFFAGPPGGGLFDLDPFRRIGSTIRGGGDILPTVDVREAGDSLEISAELPGIDEKDVTVVVKDGVLTISGEKKVEHKEDKENYHLSERSYGSFTRAFRLPEAADDEHIAADFDKGVLTIKVPKKAGAVGSERRIEVTKH